MDADFRYRFVVFLLLCSLLWSSASASTLAYQRSLVWSSFVGSGTTASGTSLMSSTPLEALDELPIYTHDTNTNDTSTVGYSDEQPFAKQIQSPQAVKAGGYVPDVLLVKLNPPLCL